MQVAGSSVWGLYIHCSVLSFSPPEHDENEFRFIQCLKKHQERNTFCVNETVIIIK